MCQSWDICIGLWSCIISEVLQTQLKIISAHKETQKHYINNGLSRRDMQLARVGYDKSLVFAFSSKACDGLLSLIIKAIGNKFAGNHTAMKK